MIEHTPCDLKDSNILTSQDPREEPRRQCLGGPGLSLRPSIQRDTDQPGQALSQQGSDATQNNDWGWEVDLILALS